MAFSAELPLGQLLHAYFPGSMRHLKEPVVTAGTFEFLSLQMVFMAEENR